MAWLIVGAGYTGAALARRLVARGDVVAITRRSAAAAAETAAACGCEGFALALGGGDDAMPALSPAAIVVCCAPPGDDPEREMGQLLAVTAAVGARKLIYVSSTGVYAPGGGAWVDEAWPIAPATRAGQRRAAAEAVLARAALPWISLRAAGIYGDDRGLVARIRAGSYRIVGDGSAHVSRIHVEDLVTAIVRAAATEVTGAVNAADDDPAPIGEVADAIAAALSVAAPPRVPIASVDPEIAGMLAADRRIANRRLRDELGVELQFPSWRALLPR